MTFDPWAGYFEAINAFCSSLPPDPDFRGSAAVLCADLDRARILARRVHRGVPDHDLARELADVLARARGDAFDLARVVEGVNGYTPSGWERFEWRSRMCALARDLARDVDDALARVRARDLEQPLDLDFVGDLARDLEDALTRVRAVRDGAPFRLDARRRTGASVASGRGAEGAEVAPAWSATRVLHAGLWVLPSTARARYREELDSELAALAAAGQSRRGQLAYALRATARMWALRCALRTPGGVDSE